MHIPDGWMEPIILALGWIVAVLGVALTLRISRFLGARSALLRLWREEECGNCRNMLKENNLEGLEIAKLFFIYKGIRI